MWLKELRKHSEILRIFGLASHMCTEQLAYLVRRFTSGANMLCGIFNITVYVFSHKEHKYMLLYCKLAGSGIRNMYIY